MKRIASLSIVLALLLPACGEDSQGYDQAQLDQARRALPTRALLTASVPEATMKGLQLNVLGAPAVFPQEVLPVATEINGTIGNLLDILEIVVEQPPTVYDSDKAEFVWGPFDDSDTVMLGDTVYVWVKDMGANSGEDFRYGYAVVRGMGRDMAKNKAVIWGAANPDPDNEDHGAGVVIWDFEANREFEDENNPNHGELDEGRFAAVYIRDDDANEPDTEVGIVVAAFRDFVAKDDQPAEPGDLDYLYGAVEGVDVRFDFMDFRLTGNLDDATEAEEFLDVQMAFYNGTGRAEAIGAGGDIPQDASIESTECWNAGLLREYYSFEAVLGDGTRQPIAPTEGEPTACTMQSLDDVPSLDDVDAEMLDALADVATNGIPTE